MFQKLEYITFSELWTVHEETKVDDGKVGNIKKAYKMIKFTGYVFINTIIILKDDFHNSKTMPQQQRFFRRERQISYGVMD